ncbi:MAG: rane-associated lipoprotein involved in thiamine biosynthesis [Verrucomicrobia bacterium]|jgi:thiamine biosynthesis lipoprotein|nr:rane-associated lipoprotein involved in thiamine biosynthesis [Verrucomicrobiota bacterium]
MLGSICLIGCQSSKKGGSKLSQRFVFHKGAMGTVFTITLYAPDEETGKRAAEAAFARVVQLNDMMTDYDRDSELMRFCLTPHGQPVKLSEDLFTVIAKAQWVAEQTDGAFDITLGPVIRLWRRARRQREVPPGELIAAAKLASGYQNLKLDAKKRTATLLKPDMVLDLGGIAKGYAAEAALTVLKQHGLNRAMVAASGDLAIGDAPPGRSGWNIGIDSIDAAEGQHSRIVSVKNCGLSTSGDTEQFTEIDGQRYSHIVDPKTGLGLRERIGVTVIAKSATDSDAYDTAASILGAERGLNFIEKQTDTAALVVVLKDGKMQQIESKRFRRFPQLKER